MFFTVNVRLLPCPNIQIVSPMTSILISYKNISKDILMKKIKKILHNTRKQVHMIFLILFNIIEKYEVKNNSFTIQDRKVNVFSLLLCRGT